MARPGRLSGCGSGLPANGGRHLSGPARQPDSAGRSAGVEPDVCPMILRATVLCLNPYEAAHLEQRVNVSTMIKACAAVSHV